MCRWNILHNESHQMNFQIMILYFESQTFRLVRLLEERRSLRLQGRTNFVGVYCFKTFDLLFIVLNLIATFQYISYVPD